MKKYCLLIIITSITFCSLWAQDSLKYRTRIQLKTTFGANLPITKLLNNDITDNLIGYSEYSFYWQAVSMSFFFHKHWGIEWNLGVSYMESRYDGFEEKIIAEYPKHYVVFSSHGDNMGVRSFLNLVYRYETSMPIFVTREHEMGSSDGRF